MKRVLVAYVTKTGSTAEVAQSIAKSLAGKGFAAEAKELGALAVDQPFAGYDAVVVGAPVNGMAWHPDASSFVARHQADLAKLPNALFLLSIAWGVGRPGMKAAIPKRLDAARAQSKALLTACFGGYMEKEPPFILRLAFGIKKGAPKDSRNWNDVSAFADSVARAFA